MGVEGGEEEAPILQMKELATLTAKEEPSPPAAAVEELPSMMAQPARTPEQTSVPSNQGELREMNIRLSSLEKEVNEVKEMLQKIIQILSIAPEPQAREPTPKPIITESDDGDDDGGYDDDDNVPPPLPFDYFPSPREPIHISPTHSPLIHTSPSHTPPTLPIPTSQEPSMAESLFTDNEAVPSIQQVESPLLSLTTHISSPIIHTSSPPSPTHTPIPPKFQPSPTTYTRKRKHD